MTSLPADVHTTLLGILGGLLSTDNNVRNEAERALERDWFTPNGVPFLLLFLAEQAAAGENDGVRAFSAVVFRRYALKMPPGRSPSMTDLCISVLDEAFKAQIRGVLHAGFFRLQSRNVLVKLADAIAEVANPDVSPAGTWDDLLPSMLEATRLDQPSMRELAYRVFGLCPLLLVQNLDQALPILDAGFSDPEDAVKQAASKAFVAAFQRTPKREWTRYLGLLPGLLNALPKYLADGNELVLALEFESLIDLVLVAPKMFRPMLSTIIAFCLAVIKNRELDLLTRLAALELLTTFAEALPSMCRADPDYAETMVVLTLQLMTEICIDDEEAIEWQNVENREPMDEEEDKAARNSLDRVSLSLGGKVLAEPLFSYLTQMLSSNEWRKRQAALMALLAAAEGCRDVLMAETLKILDLILPLLRDSHPRVQFSCCNALGQILTDFADLIQRQCGDRILPALILMLTPALVPRVQTHAAAALVNFLENALKEILEPYLDDLLTNLLTLLQGPHKFVQEQVLTTIAVVADAAETRFIKYYDTLMPLLLQFLRQDLALEDLLLKGKSIECLSLIAAAVGREKFLEHKDELIQVFSALLQEPVHEEIRLYLEQGWNIICLIMGVEFVPFLPLVLPPIMQAARAEQMLKFVEENDDLDENTWDVYPLSGKRVAINTAILEEKVEAIDILKLYAEILGGLFASYVYPVVADILLPALDFYFHDGVRHLAAQALPVFLRIVKFAPDSRPEEVSSIWEMISSKLVESIHGEPLIDIKDDYYASFGACVALMGDNLLLDNVLEAFARTVAISLQEVYKRIKERDAANTNNEEDYGEGLEEENSEFTDEELLDEINKAVLGVFKYLRFQFLKPFQDLLPIVLAFLTEENKALQLCGLCIVLDLVEHTGPNSAVFKDVFVNAVAELILSPVPTVREMGTFVVGVAATNGGEEYAEFCIAALPLLFKMVLVPDAKQEDNIIATEFAIAAIAKILTVYGSRVLDLDTMVETWIQALPVVLDPRSTQVTCGFVADLVSSNHPAVQRNVTKIVDAVLQPLAHRTLNGAGAEKPVLAVKLLLSAMPQEEAMGYFSRYGESREVLERWFS